MMPTTLRYGTFDSSRTDLLPMPIDPHWIREGAPIARSVTFSRSPDSLVSVGLWDCTAGTFTWIFERDEIIHILEGEVHVHEGNTTQVLMPGSVAYFPRGLETVWEVRTYVKKLYILRAPQESALRRAAAATVAFLSAARRRMRGLQATGVLIVLLSGAGVAQQSQPAAPPNPTAEATAADHTAMMARMGIAAVRPGPSGNESAPNHATGSSHSVSTTAATPTDRTGNISFPGPTGSCNTRLPADRRKRLQPPRPTTAPLTVRRPAAIRIRWRRTRSCSRKQNTAIVNALSPDRPAGSCSSRRLWQSSDRPGR